MIDLEQIRIEGRKVLIVGLGLSGIAAARYMAARRVSVVAVDKNSFDTLARRRTFEDELQELKRIGVDVHLTTDGEELAPLLQDIALAVLSPGVSLESAAVGTLLGHKIPYIGEFELSLGATSATSIVVTGSNGKSTTVGLIDSILKHSGRRSFICGNYGIPLSSLLEKEELQSAGPDTFLVVEASSYQLESCTSLKPNLGVWLNISENHLERHGTIDRYIEAKTRLFALQDSSDIAILNRDDPAFSRFKRASKGAIYSFGKFNTDLSAKVLYEPVSALDRVVLQLGKEEELYELSDINLRGEHNRYNIAAAILACRLSGVPQTDIMAGVRAFTPLPHRMEPLGSYRGINVINDSKSTTVAAAKAAIQMVLAESTAPLTLMLGGLSKAGSWRPVMDIVQAHLSRFTPLICFGKDGSLIASHAEALKIPVIRADGLASAVPSAFSAAKQGGVLLFSPGCASFDEFLNFEERGSRFCEIVRHSGATTAEV